MATYREYGGFHIDTIGRAVRKTLLNESITLPLALAATYLSQPSSAAILTKLLHYITTLGINPKTLNLPKFARLALCLGATGLALTTNDTLNKWVANNWTRNSRGEWADWSKEIVVVTGGSSGIGQHIVQGLLKRNPRTTIVIVDFAPLSWVPPEGMLGKTLHYYQADLSKADVVKDVCARIREEVGHPTVLVNNAGICRGFTIADGTYADTDATLRTNLTAPFLLIKEFLPHMVSTNHGHIVNISSMSAVVPPPEMVDYAASKAGLFAMHEGLSLELKYRYKAPKVRLTCLLPNFIRTPLLTGKARHPKQPQFFAPLLDVETVSERVVEALYSGYGGVHYLPGIMRYITMLVGFLLELNFNPVDDANDLLQKGGPEWLFRTLVFSTTRNMDVEFKGRQKIDETGGLMAN